MRAPFWCLLPVTLLAPLLAQAPVAPDQPAALAIVHWVDSYRQGTLGVHGELSAGALAQVPYLQAAVRAGLAGEADVGRLTHGDVLTKLVYFAEQHASEAHAAALLQLAGIGLDGEFLNLTTVQLREQGMQALLAMAGPVAGQVALRRAGETGEDGADLSARIAALQLLGLQPSMDAATALERALADAEPRVRIAACEALARAQQTQSLEALLLVMANERHAVAAQCQAQTLLVLARALGASADQALRERLVRAAMRRFGAAGWRADLELLDLVEQFPHALAVPLLIDALELCVRRSDRLEKAINQRASPRRTQRVVALLRRLTGTLLTAEDLAGWREFWRNEGANLVVPDSLAPAAAEQTRAEFYGVPVTGGAIAFLIDNSGSMDHAARSDATRTRLDLAKEQLSAAVQAMEPSATFLLYSFAEQGHRWTRTPIAAGTSAVRAVTECTGKMRADRGTDLYAGLAMALGMEQARFGELPAQAIDELFVLSDGMPTAGAVRDPERILDLVRLANRNARVAIHAIYTGNGEGSQLLRRLADENRGVFVQR